MNPATAARTEDPPPYAPPTGATAALTAEEDDILARARSIIARRASVARLRYAATSPQVLKDWLMVRLGGLTTSEEFHCVYLDSQSRILVMECAAVGTLDRVHLYPREIAKRALELGAAAVVLAHNHPSGIPEPSRSDERLTQTMKTALGALDIRVLDHMIVGGDQVVSFAERGLL